jgi:PAS domain S-box-containing protein
VKQGTLVAVLYLENNLAPSVFTPGRAAVLQLLASEAAMSLDNSRLYRELEEREAKIRQGELELRRIVDAIPQAIIILEPDGSTLGANAFMLDFTGLTLDEIQADVSRVRRFHPDDVARLEDERRKALARGEPFEAEFRIRHHDGHYRWFLVRYNPFRDTDGNVIRWYATGTDIEERKQAEERVRRENVALREEVDRSSMFEEIVGSSPPLRTVLAHLSKVAPTDSTVLISGETGTSAVARPGPTTASQCGATRVLRASSVRPDDGARRIGRFRCGHSSTSVTGTPRARATPLRLSLRRARWLSEEPRHAYLAFA